MMISPLILVITSLLLLTSVRGSALHGDQFTTVPESLQLHLLPLSPNLASTNTKVLQVFHRFGQFWSTRVTHFSLKEPSARLDGENSVRKRDMESTHGISDECMAGFAELFNTTDSAGISDGTRALDAFGEIGTAYLEGNIHAYGGFDQCLDIPDTQYCLLHLLLQDVRPDFHANTSTPQLYYALCLPRACSTEDILCSVNITNEEFHQYHYELSINWDNSMCTDTKSSTLTPGAIVMVVVCCLVLLLVVTGSLADWIRRYRKARKKECEEALQRNLTSSQTRRMLVSTLVERNQSRIQNGKKKNIMHKTLSTSCLLLGSQHKELQLDKVRRDNCNLLGIHKQTELPAPSKPNSKKHKSRVIPLDFLLAFSLFRTIPTVFSTHATNSSMRSLNGMRCISMFWLILHHTMLWLFFVDVPNNTLRLKADMLKRLPLMTLTNGSFVIDTFLFLSATLVAYLTLRQMQRAKGRFPIFVYCIHRVVRILPTFMFFTFGYWFLLQYFGNGPAWNRYIGPGRILYINCEKYWWTNMLFISNLYPWSLQDQCMGWGWFLAVDMQFYVIAPLVIVPLYKSLVFGGGILCFLVFASFSVTATITGHYELNANIFESLLELSTNPDYKSSGDYLYTKPWTRMPAYLIGLLMGYIFFRGYKLRLRKAWNTIGHVGSWALAILLCTVSLYGIYPAWNGHHFTTAENVLYATLSPFVWSVGVALVSFVCFSNCGWLAGKLLSLRFWIPLSRLSFTAYLVNPIVLIVFFGSIRDTIYVTGHTITIYGLATIILSFGLAALLAPCVEFPLSTLEVLVFRLVEMHRHESAQDSKNVKEEASSNVNTKVGISGWARAEDDRRSSNEYNPVCTSSEEQVLNGNASAGRDNTREQIQKNPLLPSTNLPHSRLNNDEHPQHPAIIIHPIDPTHSEEGDSLQLVGDLATGGGDDEKGQEETQEIWTLQRAESCGSEEEAEQEV